MDKELQVRQKYQSLQQLHGEIKELTEHIELFKEKRKELKKSVDGLKALQETKEPFFSPIAPGMFRSSENPDAVLVNVGANVLVKKSLADAEKMLQEQVDDLKQVTREFTGRVQEQTIAASKAEQELQELVKDV